MNSEFDGNGNRLTRRQFLRAGALTAGGLALGSASTEALSQYSSPSIQVGGTPPNILLIMADQLSIDALSGHGSLYAKTPNIDRLIQRGVTFRQSYSSNPVCSPARSSIMTGRMPVETSVTENEKAIRSDMPNIGQWFSSAGYETIYCGKWHLAGGYPNKITGFTVLPSGVGNADVIDSMVSRSCESYLKQRSRTKPFLLVASLLQPHDICFWTIWYHGLVPTAIPYAELKSSSIPALPPNHQLALPEPAGMATDNLGLSDLQWQYYNWIYYRQTEMLDADVGRILDALESSGQADNTIIVFTSDHGECRGRHGKRGKWYPYDESSKVPLVISWPGRIAEKISDNTHLASGIDIVPTLCDLVGIATPPMTTAKSLRPLLEQKATTWRDFLVVETQIIGRTVRSSQFKYVDYKDDSQKMLFKMQADPWETSNLFGNAFYNQTVTEHQQMLAEWNGRIIPAL